VFQDECLCTNSTCGAGMLDAAAAVAAAAGQTPTPTPTPTPAPVTDSGGGGGAMQIGWLAGLLLAVVALAWRRHRARG
jgi:serine protease